MRPSPVQRVMGAIVPRAVDAIDPDELLDRIDIDALLARIDLQDLLERIDLGPVLDRVDVDGLVQRIDLDAVLARVDIDELMGRIDVDALVARLDLDALVSRLDVDGLLQQVDIAALVARAGIDQIVRDATSGIASRTLDLARRQVLGVDVVVLGIVDRVVRRRRTDPPAPVSRPGGPLARFLAFLIDSVVVSGSFGLVVALGASLIGLFTGATPRAERGDGPWWVFAYLGWWFTYLWLAVSIAGRTVGKAVLGVRVLAVDGRRLRPARAALRALLLPFSLVFGIGFLPAVIGRRRRALHDLLAGSMVVVDWGPREASLPGPLDDWIAERRSKRPPLATAAAMSEMSTALPEEAP